MKGWGQIKVLHSSIKTYKNLQIKGNERLNYCAFGGRDRMRLEVWKGECGSIVPKDRRGEIGGKTDVSK